MTFAEAIEAEAGQEIIACVILSDEGRIQDWGGKRDPRDVSASKCRVVLPWSEARALLDYEWKSGFGWQDCHDLARLLVATRADALREAKAAVAAHYADGDYHDMCDCKVDLEKAIDALIDKEPTQ